MKLIPSLKTVEWSSTKSGDLLRVCVKKESFLGLATKNSSSGRTVAGMVTLREGSAPRFIPIQSTEGFVLSYGQEYAFHVPHTARFLSSFEDNAAAMGALVVANSGTLIRVSQEGAPCYYDIETGDSAHEVAGSECWVALDWEIKLVPQSADEPAFFSFCAAVRSASRSGR
jgi:hypothetical protein